MGPFIYSNSGHTAYGVKEYICDAAKDVDLLPLDDTPGSSALVIDSGDLYILNSKHEWKRQGGGGCGPSTPSEDTSKLEAQIKELQKTVETLTKQVSDLTAANQELVQKIEELEAELEKEDVVIYEETGAIVLPEEEVSVQEETGTLTLKNAQVKKETGTLVLN